MDIRQNILSIGRKIAAYERAVRLFRCGLGPMPVRVNETALFRQLLHQICVELATLSRKTISFEQGVSPRIFWLLVDGHKFAILSIPNPCNGRAYIQFLNRKKQVCSANNELRILQPVCDHINSITQNQ